jgi:hypothetical protein
VGIDPPGSRGALWFDVPVPGGLSDPIVQRAVAASRHCDWWEAWPLLGFALSGAECLELAESHPALAYLVANSKRIGGRYRDELPAGERARFDSCET